MNTLWISNSSLSHLKFKSIPLETTWASIKLVKGENSITSLKRLNTIISSVINGTIDFSVTLQISIGLEFTGKSHQIGSFKLILSFKFSHIIYIIHTDARAVYQKFKIAKFARNLIKIMLSKQTLQFRP